MAHVAYHWKGRRIILKSVSRKLQKLGVRGASLSNISKVFNGQYEPGYGLAVGIMQLMNLEPNEFSEMLEFCRKLYEQHKQEEGEWE